jgi:hypothetical protein
MRLYPTSKQFRNWSLPSKYTLISFVVGSILSGLSVYYGVRPNPQLVLVERVLRGEKPTKLATLAVDLGWHLGVDSELVFADVHNQSSRPAYEFRAMLVLHESPLRRPIDEAIKMFGSGNILIPPDGSLRLPIAYKSDVMSALKLRCVSSFSLSAQPGEPNSLSVPLAIKLEYTTVFEEKVSSLESIWAVVPEACV